MKIFNSGSGWDSKVNFVDDNNVLVGYDTDQDCCEHASWFITSKEANNFEGFELEKAPEGAENYSFDVNYFENVAPYDDGDGWGHCLDAGGMVRFKLVSDGKPDLFLHLFNCHNGYYGHGFEAKIGGQDWQEGTL